MSRAPTPQLMNQRPSFEWLMFGVWFGAASAWRQVMRHSGACCMTQDIRSSSVFFATASCTAQLTSWPSPVRLRCSRAATMPVAICSPAML